MNKLLIATKNPTKLKEYQGLLASYHLDLVSLADVGITQDVKAAGYLNHRKKAILQLAPHLKALENN